MKKHLYLIRHGVTNHMANNIQQSATSELSDHGHAQAAALAKRFGGPTREETNADIHERKDFHIDTLATSPYTRAQQTAAHIASDTGLQSETISYVHERRVPSSLEGSPIHGSAREAIIEQIFKLWVAGKNERLADEETYADLVVRVDLLKDFVVNAEGQHIAVVSHATFIKTFLSTIFHADLRSPRTMWSLYHSHEVANTGISEFTFDPDKDEGAQWRLVTWNDHSHLFHLGL
jgi:broad specificity phosphatase PhoE